MPTLEDSNDVDKKAGTWREITTRMWISLAGATTQGGFFFIASFGTGGLFAAGVTSNVSAFPSRYRGMVVGLMFGGYGLCATLLTGIFNGAFDASDLAGFQLFLAISSVTVCFIAMFFLIPVEKNEEWVGEGTARDAIPSNADKERLLADGNANGDKEVDDEVSKELVDEDDSVTPALEYTGRLQRVWLVLWEKLTSSTFWLLFIILFLGSGAGLLHINNIGQLTKSLNGNLTFPNAVFICVTLQSVFSFLGRLGTGISDYIPIRRGWFLSLGLLMMAVAHLCAATLFIDGSDHFGRLYAMTVFNGTAYGIMFSVTPTVVTETFEPADFGQNWGWMVLASAASSFAFNGFAGFNYNNEIDAHNEQGIPVPTDDMGAIDENACVGMSCFRDAYWFGAGMAFLGFLLTFVVMGRTKVGKRDKNVDDERSGSGVIEMKKTMSVNLGPDELPQVVGSEKA